MTVNAADFSIDNTTKVIEWTGTNHGLSGANYYTVLELHRWLQDLADNANVTGDDYMDISHLTPSDRSYDTIITLINGYTITDKAAEHLYGGSIIQANGDTIYDGVQIIAAPNFPAQITQNGAVVVQNANSAAVAPFWNNVPYGTGLTGLNPDPTNGISHRFLLKVRSGGADIDGRRLLVWTREFGYSYSEFQINGTGRGINVAPLTYAVDLNNQTASATVSGWSDITNGTAGYNTQDVNSDSVNEAYYSKWTKGAHTTPQLYERMKYITRRGETTALYGIPGQLFRGITHQVPLSGTHSGTFSAFEAVSWTGGTGQMLAIDSTTAGTKMWIQLLTGVAPTSSQLITGGTSGATHTCSGTPTAETVSQPFCGLSTGLALLGAFGFGVLATDLGANDRVVDLLTGANITPPNNQTFSVTNLSASPADQILVGPASGGALYQNQFTLSASLTGAAVTSVAVNVTGGGNLPADTPATGTIRIQRNNGAYSSHAYTARSITGKTFTIASTDFSSNNASSGNNCFQAYIDKSAGSTSETFSLVYAADRDLFVRVRNAAASPPIKTFENVGAFTSTGGTMSVIRTSDA